AGAQAALRLRWIHQRVLRARRGLRRRRPTGPVTRHGRAMERKCLEAAAGRQPMTIASRRQPSYRPPAAAAPRHRVNDADLAEQELLGLGAPPVSPGGLDWL